jgi:hypothetical protein
MMPPIRAFCKGWTPTGPAGTLPGTVAVWPSDRDGARATWARPAASRRRSVKVHVRVSRAEQFGNKRCPTDLVVREGDHGCRLRGNSPHSWIAGVSAGQRRQRSFPPSPRNGEVRPIAGLERDSDMRIADIQPRRLGKSVPEPIRYCRRHWCAALDNADRS